MKEIALLPDSLSRTPSVGMAIDIQNSSLHTHSCLIISDYLGLVSSWYERSFEEVLRYEQMEPTTTNMER